MNQSVSTELKPHEQRVVDEKADLDGRLSRLRTFCQEVGGSFDSLSTVEKQLLTEQEGLMAKLSDVLARRIALFNRRA